MGSVLGSILDPAADKLLMTTMVVTLAMKSMLPRTPLLSAPFPRSADALHSRSIVPLAVLIIGRDVALSLSAFYFRYASLPPPVRPVLSPSISHADPPNVAHRKPLPAIGISPSPRQKSSPPTCQSTTRPCNSSSSARRRSPLCCLMTSPCPSFACSAFHLPFFFCCKPRQSLTLTLTPTRPPLRARAQMASSRNHFRLGGKLSLW